jgi:hypothetical protein
MATTLIPILIVITHAPMVIMVLGLGGRATGVRVEGVIMVRGVQVTGGTVEEVIMVRGGMEGIADSFGSQDKTFFNP